MGFPFCNDFLCRFANKTANGMVANTRKCNHRVERNCSNTKYSFFRRLANRAKRIYFSLNHYASASQAERRSVTKHRSNNILWYPWSERRSQLAVVSFQILYGRNFKLSFKNYSDKSQHRFLCEIFSHARKQRLQLRYIVKCKSTLWSNSEKGFN